MKILIVEDEIPLAEAVAQILKKNNYGVDIVHNGEDGLDCGLSGIYDIIVLDVMLPGRDGLSVLKELRQNGVNIPVLLLTAKSETRDKVQGLDSGADDYLTKPFSSEELLARLRALGRRKNELISDGILKFGDAELDPSCLIMSCRGEEIKLTLKECQLMELLIGRKGRVVPKDTIIEKLWGFDTNAEDNHVEVYISFLRKKINHIRAGVSIRTVRGAGYLIETAGYE